MRTYRGAPALSELRLAKLLQRIRLEHAAVTAVAAEDVYFVQCSEDFPAPLVPPQRRLVSDSPIGAGGGTLRQWLKLSWSS
jgi:hypothetical protein